MVLALIFERGALFCYYLFRLRSLLMQLSMRQALFIIINHQLQKTQRVIAKKSILAKYTNIHQVLYVTFGVVSVCG